MWSAAMVAAFAALCTITLSSEATVPIVYLPEERYETKLGGEVSANIYLVGHRDNNACKLIDPEGKEYDLTKDVPEGISFVTDDKISCGVTMEVRSAKYVGDWTLAADETIFNRPHEERRLKFNVYVEEHVNTSPRDAAVVAEGNDFYLRLESPVDSDVKCHVEGPNAERVEVDTRTADNCGFVLKNAKESDSGTWTIVYGENIVYKAAVQLAVTPALSSSSSVTDLTLNRDRSVDQSVGPDNAVYCMLLDPSGFAVYDGFGQCRMTLNRVRMEHQGTWTLKATLPGRVLMNEYQLRVTVNEADSKPEVKVTVDKQQPAVFLSCAVTTTQEVKACKFRDPAGNVLIASGGVGEDRYTFFGKGTTVDNGVYTHDCGLQISSPEASDLGLWRCAMETDEEKYFGFLTVLCPWAMRDPKVAASVVSEPILSADKKEINALDGDSVTMSCKIQTPIRYCYFRARNGTIFSVGPETSTDRYSYSGAGFNAGECGITFKNIYYSDGGAWSCHVGFLDSKEAEQRDAITLTVTDLLSVNQYAESSVRLMVVAQAYEQRALDYCRFVRIDGLGFTDATPNDAKTINDLSTGICRLRIRNPTILDHHPWTVVAKVTGVAKEITGVTRHTISSDVPNPHPVDDENKPGDVIYYVRTHSMVYVTFFLIIFPLIIVGLLMIRRSSREWAYNRSAHARNSFRRFFRRDTNTVLVEDLNGRRFPDAVVIDNELPRKEALP